jgi:cytochrome c-type biogenesis protein CcmH
VRVFWLIAIVLTGGVVAVLVRPLLDKPQGLVADGHEDMQVYRDQLAEVDSDLARGVLSEDEAERTRLEVSRRLLEADKLVRAGHGAAAGATLSRIMAGAVALGLIGAAFGVYFWIGANGAPDMPLATRNADMEIAQAARPSQLDLEAAVGNDTSLAEAAGQDYRDLVAQLRTTASERPNDQRGQELLALHEARLGNFAAAWTAQANVIALKGEAADAADYTELAELMIFAGGGIVSPEAEMALSEAIKRDPRNGRARYYSGLDLAQNGRPDIAYRLWRDLLAEGPEDAPWMPPIRDQIGDVARMAGIEEAMPGLSGPSDQQIKDAQSMSAEDQQQMIRDMVGRLSERLASEGGSAPEWARLIRAYGVLGEADKAAAIWAEAKAKFSNDAEAMAGLKAAAAAAGLDP